MASPASVAKHPFHPMLVVFPVGLWVFSLVSDIVFYAGGAPVWRDIAFWTMAGGIIGALLAAVPGFIDFQTLSGRPQKIAAYHMAINLGLVVLFAINLWLRTGGDVYIALSVIGVIGLMISGWLGGELVYVEGIAVERRAASVAEPEAGFEDDYWAAYSYVVEKLKDGRLEGKPWLEVEDDLHKEWDKAHPGTWPRFKNTIHRSWEARH
jgi:uncharacterized membrane protein